MSWTKVRYGASAAIAVNTSNGEARDLLAPIYERFTEGSGTTDLQAGKKLLDELNSPHRRAAANVHAAKSRRR